jgi:hypothetical protein
MPDVRIFLSYDLEHDADLRDRLIAEAERGGSGFEITGYSESTSDPGEARLRRRIGASDEVIVVCGEHTDESPAASLELRIAQEEGKPYFLLWGRRESMCKRPASARPTDSMFSWTAAILRHQIEATLRSARPPEIPESCKRVVPRPKAQTGS